MGILLYVTSSSLVAFKILSSTVDILIIMCLVWISLGSSYLELSLLTGFGCLSPLSV